MSGKQIGRGSEERCKMPWGREVPGMPVGGRPKAPHLEDRAQVGPEGKKKGTSPATGVKTLQTEGKWHRQTLGPGPSSHNPVRLEKWAEGDGERDESGKDD